ncbi:MAG TPA: Sec-independent protein translocase protein TatB [Acidimicrobiales bacterium]
MFNIGGGELLVILLIALIVLGPQRLPDAARTVGRVLGDLRRISSGFQQELKEAFDDPDGGATAGSRPRTRRESTPLAASVEAVEAGAGGDDPDGDAADEDAAGARASAAGDTGRGDDGGPADDGRDTVAPGVAAAIDEIVTPIDAAPAAGPDDVDDERAAS